MAEAQVKTQSDLSIECENTIADLLKFVEAQHATDPTGKLLVKMSAMFVEWNSNSKETMSFEDWLQDQAKEFNKTVQPLLKAHMTFHVKERILDKYFRPGLPSRVRDIAQIYIGLNVINGNSARAESRKKWAGHSAKSIITEHKTN